MKKMVIICISLIFSVSILIAQDTKYIPAGFRDVYGQYKQEQIQQILATPEFKKMFRDKYAQGFTALSPEDQKSYEVVSELGSIVKQDLIQKAEEQIQQQEERARIERRDAFRQEVRESFVRKTPFESDLDVLWYPEVEREQEKEKQERIKEWETFKNNAKQNTQYIKDAEAIIAYEKLEPSKIGEVVENLIAQDFVALKNKQEEDDKRAEQARREVAARALTAADEARIQGVKSFASKAKESFKDKRSIEEREISARNITAKEEAFGSYLRNLFSKARSNAASWWSPQRESVEEPIDQKQVKKWYKAAEQPDIMTQMQNIKEREQGVAEETAWDLYKSRPQFQERARKTLMSQGVQSPTATQVELEADKLAAQSYGKLQQLRQQPQQMVTPIPVPAPKAPTWGQRASNWWSSLKQRFSTPQSPTGPHIWLKR
jgi:hypothetical protein